MSVIEQSLLTPEQRAIVEIGIDRPCVVDAGAGTGKTFTLVQRALHLVERGLLGPSELLLVTFMNKAAIEIGERLTVAFSKKSISELPTVATFHGLAAGLVREFSYEAGLSPDLRTIDDFRARAVFNRAFKDLLDGKLQADLSSFPLLERDEILPRSLANLALKLKNRGISIDRFEAEALAAADELRKIPFGQLYTIGKRGPKERVPKIPFTVEERVDEARRERMNVAVVAAVFRRFDALFEAESLMTYGDILSRATAMLRANPSIATTLRKRWRHAMIDEFQDTNPEQLEFLRAIFGEELSCVMAVGDVRQAIFEWNGADPRGIQVIARRPGTTSLPLSHNRRSPQQILDMAHHVLPVLADYRGEPLTAHKGASKEVVLRIASFCRGSDTAENRFLEAEAIAAEIDGLIRSGVRPRDIVILMRSRSPARIYSAALAARGIFSKTHGGVGFFDAPELRDAVAWLRLLDDPTDAFALTRILESPVVGISQGTLAKLYGMTKARAELILTDPLPDWLSSGERGRLERLRAILRKLDSMVSVPAPDAIRAVIAETALDLAHGLHDPATERQIRANVAKFVALAVGFTEDRPLAQLADFLDEIDERDALEIDEPEAELSGDEVSLMTVHSAKGLEWEYVFLANVSPGVFPNSSGGNETVAEYDDRSRALAMRYDLNGQKTFRWILRDPHNAETGERLPKPEKDEERRLLYVALTRAKRAVWVSGVFNNTPSAFLHQIGRFCESRDDATTFGEHDATAPLAVKKEKFAVDEASVNRIVERLSRALTLFDAPAHKLSYSAISTYGVCPRLARYRYVFRIPDLREELLPTLFDGDDDADRTKKLDPALFGDIVHRALELVALARIDGVAFAIGDVVDTTLDEFELASNPSLRARVIAAASHAVDRLAPYETLAAEAEFDTTIAGVHIGGYIDLIARAPDGTIHIIDYKTGRVPDEHYALQLALYRAAVAETYPDSKGAILRISEDGAEFRSPELPGTDEMECHVRAAAGMRDDIPKTGIQCRSCPYAGELCPEGARAIACASA